MSTSWRPANPAGSRPPLSDIVSHNEMARAVPNIVQEFYFANSLSDTNANARHRGGPNPGMQGRAVCCKPSIPVAPVRNAYFLRGRLCPSPAVVSRIPASSPRPGSSSARRTTCSPTRANAHHGTGRGSRRGHFQRCNMGTAARCRGALTPLSLPAPRAQQFVLSIRLAQDVRRPGTTVAIRDLGEPCRGSVFSARRADSASSCPFIPPGITISVAADRRSSATRASPASSTRSRRSSTAGPGSGADLHCLRPPGSSRSGPASVAPVPPVPFGHGLRNRWQVHRNVVP